MACHQVRLVVAGLGWNGDVDPATDFLCQMDKVDNQGHENNRL